MIDELRDWLEDNADGVKAVAAALAGAMVLWWLLADPPVEVGPSPGAGSRVVILLHGHGASKTDLEPLAEELALLAPGVSFIMPSGTHRAMMGRTWYPSFREDSQEAVRMRMLEIRAEAREVVTEIAQELTSDGVSPNEIYVGGFSQGATVALDAVLADEQGLGGLVSLSGGALPLDLALLEARGPVRAFVSHGVSDSVLRIGGSQAIVGALRAADHPVEFIEFEGRHEIPDEVVQALGAFLAEP